MFDFFDSIQPGDRSFSTAEKFYQNVVDDVEVSRLMNHQVIGQSEEGRPIHGFVAGEGNQKIALVGGAHSDEPVGPEMLRLLVRNFIENEKQAKTLLQQYTFIILPHINPDGEAKNRRWIKHWPEISPYVAHAFREPPGRDLEFGYPDMRPENRAVAELLRQFAPFDLYINFHGMGFAEGLMLLIERHWIDRSRQLRSDFKKIAQAHKLPLHDHDRGGEKGFTHIGPGFTTTPEGKAMQRYFKEKGDEETASKFHQSSMEYIRSLDGDPLCLVTELPLYIVKSKEGSNSKPGVPQSYLKLKKDLSKLRKRASNGDSLEPILKKFEINHLPLQTAVEIQLSVIKKALEMLSER